MNNFGNTLPIMHGSIGGYQTHRNRGEAACADCKKAKAEYERKARARRKAYE